VFITWRIHSEVTKKYPARLIFLYLNKIEDTNVMMKKNKVVFNKGIDAEVIRNNAATKNKLRIKRLETR
jgi:hypothetical protein